MSKKSKTKKTKGMKDKADQSLELQAEAIARRYGEEIGRDGLYWAVEQFEPEPDSFDEDGKLTFEGAAELIRLMGEAALGIADNTSGVWSEMTKAELNIIRENQCLPPV
jgi:hypothetical protein